MFKYLCTLESGRDFVLTSDINDDVERSEVLAWAAIEESKLMDDYLIDVKRID